MGTSRGAWYHSLLGTILHPTLKRTQSISPPAQLPSYASPRAHASNSSSLKHLILSFSTKISNPLSINVLAVLGVKADRRSCSFFSHRSQRAWWGLVDDEGPAVEGRGAGAAEVDSDMVGSVTFALMLV